MKYRFEQLNLRDNEHYLALKQVEEWSDMCKTMRSYNFTQLVRHSLGLLAFLLKDNDPRDRGRFAGHVAITEINEIGQRNFAKIGALAVGEEDQGNGLASALIGELVRITPEAVPADIEGYYAYAHPDSLDSFLANGASVVGTRSTVPPPTGCNIIVAL